MQSLNISRQTWQSRQIHTSIRQHSNANSTQWNRKRIQYAMQTLQLCQRYSPSGENIFDTIAMFAFALEGKTIDIQALHISNRRDWANQVNQNQKRNLNERKDCNNSDIAWLCSHPTQPQVMCAVKDCSLIASSGPKRETSTYRLQSDTTD